MSANNVHSRGWTFASENLEFFLSKKSPGPDYVLQGSAADAAKIKNNLWYRMQMAKVLPGNPNGHTEIYFFGGELFYALGNGHFSWTGKETDVCQLFSSYWTWEGTVVQKDNYVFRRTSPGMHIDAYAAAEYLQDYCNYPTFWDRQEWTDSFQGSFAGTTGF